MMSGDVQSYLIMQFSPYFGLIAFSDCIGHDLYGTNIVVVNNQPHKSKKMLFADWLFTTTTFVQICPGRGQNDLKFYLFG